MHVDRMNINHRVSYKILFKLMSKEHIIKINEYDKINILISYLKNIYIINSYDTQQFYK